MYLNRNCSRNHIIFTLETSSTIMNSRTLLAFSVIFLIGLCRNLVSTENFTFFNEPEVQQYIQAYLLGGYLYRNCILYKRSRLCAYLKSLSRHSMSCWCPPGISYCDCGEGRYGGGMINIQYFLYSNLTNYSILW